MLDSEIQRLVKKINQDIELYRVKGKKIFASSSFQSHSIPLLHIISLIEMNIPVYFIDTGFHFPESLSFVKTIQTLLNIEVVNVESPIVKSKQRDSQNRFLYCSDTDYCCHINKVLPLEPIISKHDVWITGVRQDQSSHRQSFSYEAQGPFNSIRYHPMIEWNQKMIWQYSNHHGLPKHPLEEQGYLSIGCAPCTLKFGEGERGGRWQGQQKTECGLHTNLISE